MVAATRPARLPLRDYQLAAKEKVHASYAAGITRQVLHLATGAGKTVLAAHIIADWLDRMLTSENPWCAPVFLVNRDELITQSVDKLKGVIDGVNVGVVQGKRNELDGDVLVSSVQTLAQEKRLANLLSIREPGGLVVSDECHHDLAPTRWQVIEALDPELLIGLTATPFRTDGKGLARLGYQKVYSCGLIELMARGHLCLLKGIRVPTETNLDTVKVSGEHGDFTDSALAGTVDNVARNARIVAAWQQYASDRKRTVVFACTVQHAANIAGTFQAAGIDARLIHGGSKDRGDLLKGFHNGDFPVLVNCMILTEGWDEPRTDCLIIARPTKSKSLYIQMVGRGARTAPDISKEDCLVIDVSDMTRAHSLFSLSDLADDEEVDEGDDDEPVQKKSRPEPPAGAIIDLLALAAEQQKIRDLVVQQADLLRTGQYHWLCLDDGPLRGYYIASVAADSYLVLIPKGEHYIPAAWIQPEQEAAYRPRPRLVRLFDRELPLDLALALAEQRATEYVPGIARWAKRKYRMSERKGYSWRSLHASDAQVALAARYGATVPALATMADASDIIDRAKFTNRWLRFYGRN